MYIANNAVRGSAECIIDFLPHALRKYFYTIDISKAYEIQLCPGRPISVYYPGKRLFISHKGILTDNPYEAIRATSSHIDEAIELASKSSVYSVEDEIRNGFITIDGGHRIGICGSAVIRDGKIAFVRDISALNYRLAREIKGAADEIINAVINNGTVHSTLVISPPGAGKTTMLRDIARQLSNAGVRVCIVDERREIAAMRNGKTDFDLGSSVTVFSGAPKAAGMLMMLRAMSPDVILTDELGTLSDSRAAARIINSGTRVITSVHGYDMKQISNRRDLKLVLKYFETIIVLSKRKGIGTVEEVITR